MSLNFIIIVYKSFPLKNEPYKPFETKETKFVYNKGGQNDNSPWSAAPGTASLNHFETEGPNFSYCHEQFLVSGGKAKE